MYVILKIYKQTYLCFLSPDIIIFKKVIINEIEISIIIHKYENKFCI